MSDVYCQFPLCLLAYPAAFGDGDRLLHILGYSVGEYGKRLWPRYGLDEREYLRAHPPEWCTTSLEEDRHLQAVIACEELELIPDSIFTVIAYHAASTRFIDCWEFRHGPDATVRIRVDWMLEALHGTGISYNELAVLAAIYSKIGASKKAVRITQEEVWRRAVGSKSKDVFRVERDYDIGFRPTKRQVRSIIERLHGRGFFAPVTAGRRQTYYSHRLSATALTDYVFRLKTQRSVATQARRRADAALTKRIQAERRKLADPGATSGATDGATDMPL